MTQDQVDASRYRWLRERWGRISEKYAGETPEVMSVGDDPDGWMVDPASLDAAIDAAMGPRYTITEAGRKMLEEK